MTADIEEPAVFVSMLTDSTLDTLHSYWKGQAAAFSLALSVRDIGDSALATLRTMSEDADEWVRLHETEKKERQRRATQAEHDTRVAVRRGR